MPIAGAFIDRPPTCSLTGPSSATAGTATGWTVTASDPDGSIAALSLAWGDGSTQDVLAANGRQVAHTYGAAGTVTLTLTATDNAGLTATSTLTVTVAAAPPPPASFPPVLGVVITQLSTGAVYDASGACLSAQTQVGSTSGQDTGNPAGTATLVMDDSSGVFDPSNTSSPIYGWLTPGASSIQVRRVEGGTVYPLYTGKVESVTRTWPGAAGYSETVITLVDQTKDYSRHFTASAYDAAGNLLPNPSYGSWRPAESVSARIGNLAIAPSRTGYTPSQPGMATYPAAAINHGQKQLAAWYSDGKTDTWSLMALAALSEHGNLFFDAKGELTYHEQTYRSGPAATAWTLGDNTGEISVSDATAWVLNDDQLVDDAAVMTADGRSASAGPNGDGQPASGLQTALASLEAAASYARYLYARDSQPRRRVQQVTVDAYEGYPTTSATGYALALQVRLDDLVTLNRRPAGQPADTGSYYVTGISHQIDSGWSVVLTLALAETTTGTTLWRLGTSQLGASATSPARLTW